MQHIQEEEQTQAINLTSQQPVVIPRRESIQSDIYELRPLSAEFSGNGNCTIAESVPEIVKSLPAHAADEQIYSNINYMPPQTNENNAQPQEKLLIVLPEYIEDTKIQAIALYDYQASTEDKIYFISFHPLVKDVLLTATYEMIMIIWNSEHTDRIFDCAWSLCCVYVSTVCKDGEIRIFIPRQSENAIREGPGPIHGARITWAIDGHYIVCTSFDK